MIQLFPTQKYVQNTPHLNTERPTYSYSIHNREERESAFISIIQWTDNELNFILLKRKVKSAVKWKKMKVITANNVALTQSNKHCIQIDLKFKSKASVFHMEYL